MNRKALLNDPAGISRQPATEALPFAHLPDFVGAAAVQTHRSALNFEQHSAQPALPLLMTDPADLVVRALEILAEENDAWRARRGLNRPPRSIR